MEESERPNGLGPGGVVFPRTGEVRVSPFVRFGLDRGVGRCVELVTGNEYELTAPELSLLSSCGNGRMSTSLGPGEERPAASLLGRLLLLDTAGLVRIRRMLVSNIDLELSAVCNARCTFCPRRELEGGRGVGLMGPEVFREVVAKLDDVPEVGLSGLGEPTLNPHLLEYVDCLARRGKRVFLNTNASRLTPRFVEQLIAAGLRRIKISFTGTDEQSYARTMVGLDFATVLGSVDAVIRQVRGRIPIEVSGIVTAGTTGHVDEARAFWAARGVAATLTGCHSRGGTRPELSVFEGQNGSAPCRCGYFSLMSFVAWDGRILACCHDTDGATALGTLLEDDLSTIVDRKLAVIATEAWFPICSVCDEPFRLNRIGMPSAGDSTSWPAGTPGAGDEGVTGPGALRRYAPAAVSVARGSLAGRRVLCAAQPIPGHNVPVSILAEAFRAEGADVCMLSYSHESALVYERHGLPYEPMVEGVDLPVLFGQTKAILDRFAPDVTLCDWRVDFWLALRGRPPPCAISVLRCEQFLGYERIAQELPDKFLHTHGGRLAGLNDLLSAEGGRPVADLRELMVADIIAVPSIPQMDPPPPASDPRYSLSSFVYTGPLFRGRSTEVAPAVAKWISRMRRECRPVVVVTTGTCWGAEACAQLAHCCRHAEWATVMVVADTAQLDSLREFAGERLLLLGYSALLPLFRSCDLVLHHCGHATCLIALLAGKPALVLPSGEYDREDAAIRLEGLSCGMRIGPGMDLSEAIERMVHDPHVQACAERASELVRRQMATHGPTAVVRAAAEHLQRRADGFGGSSGRCSSVGC